MRKINDTMNRLAVAAYVEGGRMRKKLADVLTRKEGEGFVDTALKILISVVVGALLLAGLYALFKDTILPTLTQRIQNLFNYQGNDRTGKNITFIENCLPGNWQANFMYMEEKIESNRKNYKEFYRCR